MCDCVFVEQCFDKNCRVFFVLIEGSSEFIGWFVGIAEAAADALVHTGALVQGEGLCLVVSCDADSSTTLLSTSNPP